MFSGARQTTIDLIRHGEPVGGRLFRGSQDDPLSERGWSQMRAAVDGHAPWNHIVSSPLLRCQAFAHELASSHAIPLTIEDGLREVHFGEWEGLTTAEVQAHSPGLLEKVWSDSLAHTPPGGETLIDFSARVTDAWIAVLERHAGEHLLVPAHGGTIRAILCHTLNIPLASMWRFDVEYASITRLKAWRQEDGEVNYSLSSHAAPLSVHHER